MSENKDKKPLGKMGLIWEKEVSTISVIRLMI